MARLLKFIPESLPESETLEYRASSAIADGTLVMQFNRGPTRVMIDLSSSVKLGKGLLGKGEIRARSEWQKTDSHWGSKGFFYESSLWGMHKTAHIDFENDQLDVLSVVYALRAQPIREAGDHIIVVTKDETKTKTIELYGAEKKRDAIPALGDTEVVRIELKELESTKAREAIWKFWMETQANILVKIRVGHQRWGELEFKLVKITS
jgi:hypothetical protein